MQRVMQRLDERVADYEKAPLFAFLRDTSIEPERRLAFLPSVAHFVMSFADLYGLVLREEPPRDKYQELVNAHTREDGDHWKWFLADLDKLGMDKEMPFSDALRAVWNEGTVQMRMLTYHMVRLGFQASSLRKLVLVHCIEATGKVTVKHVSAVGKELSMRTGKKLTYVGGHHFETESKHTLEEDAIHDMVAGIELEAAQADELCGVVDESFRHFTAFADEMLTLAAGSGARS